MAQFFKVFNMQGFDRHRTPRWQMVPLSGTRYVALREGRGLTVTSLNPAVVNVSEILQSALPSGAREPLQASDRIFCLSGVTAGSGVIQAAGPGAVNLEVNVKPHKTVGIHFNFVRDNARHATRRVPAQAAQWVIDMNSIFTGQANIEIINKGATWVSVARNLGSRITTTTNGVGEEAHLYPLGDPNANINMFLVWAMDITDDTADEAGFADGNRIVFEDTTGMQAARSMAHEVGHVLGVDDQYTTRRELMYGYTNGGVDLPRDHVNTMNP
jgi:hypothetical protein